MNITKHDVDDLNAVIKIAFQPADYQLRVSEVLKKYAKTAKVPGFRPGHVPVGMIKKMYGTSVLLEELNKLVSESLGKYIYDNKIEIIGTPLPKRGESEMILEEGRDFEFLYEIGLAPQFSISLPKDKIPYYLMKVDDKMVEEDLTDIRRRYGKFSNPEISDENSILYGEFKELDAAGQLKEGGTTAVTTLAIDRIKTVKNRKRLIGLKKEDTADFNPMDYFGNETEVAAMLKIGKDNTSLKSDYRFTVMTISHIEKAELNQELFDKLHEPGTVTTEESFRDKIREGIAAYFERESDRKLQKDLRNRMLADTGISLPDDFLKRMLKANQEKEVEEQEFEHSYYHLAEDLRWNLIVSKIAAEQNIQLTEEEIRQLSRSIMRQQFAQYGVYDMEESRLQEMSDRYLNQEGAYEKLERSLRESKVFEYLKSNLLLDRKELSQEDFADRMNEKTEHELSHH